MHGEGSPVFSPSALVPTFPTATCHHHTQQLARSRSQKSQPCPRRCSPGSLGRGDAPGARTVSPACQHLPGGWWGGRPWRGAGQGDRRRPGGRGEAQPPGRAGRLGPGEQARWRRHPLVQAKLRRRGEPGFLRHRPDARPLRTDWHYWGRTATTGRWRGRSWHL